MNRSLSPVSLLILLTLALQTSSIAKSDDFSRSGAYIGASGAFGISLFEDDLEASSPRSLKLADSAGFQIKTGYRLNEWLALEAQ